MYFVFLSATEWPTSPRVEFSVYFTELDAYAMVKYAELGYIHKEISAKQSAELYRMANARIRHVYSIIGN